MQFETRPQQQQQQQQQYKYHMKCNFLGAQKLISYAEIIRGRNRNLLYYLVVSYGVTLPIYMRNRHKFTFEKEKRRL